MKIGLLGFGSMGRTHLYSVRNIPFFFNGEYNIEVASVCTAHLDKARDTATRFSIPNYTDNEDDIIYNSEIDIIDVCTPNIYHYNTVKKAILAGKHVYCEKPLAVTYEQARELATLAKEKGVICGIVFNNRFLSPILKAKELVENDKLGKIISFSIKYLHSSALDTNKNAGWKQDRDICGGGTFFDLGPHVVDLIYYLCGEFDEVMGKAQIAYPERKGVDGSTWQTNADEAFYMLATLKNGAHGTIEVSKITTGANDDLRFEIHGEKGSIMFDLMQPNYLELYDATVKDGDYGTRGYKTIECVNRYPSPAGIFPGQKAPIGWLRGHIGSYFEFIKSVFENKQFSPSLDDGAYVQKILERATISSKENRWIKI
ncbi:MAG: Gfo/Idh/MocA family oxidoreductase [Clostridia bacterium]|nr:Gfo/Idh/MocA family oxidoreductase [Clostridia bacterium]